jgi:hypothetical protein
MFLFSSAAPQMTACSEIPSHEGQAVHCRLGRCLIRTQDCSFTIWCICQWATTAHQWASTTPLGSSSVTVCVMEIEPSKYSNWIIPQSWRTLQFFLCFSICFMQNRTKFHCCKTNTSCFAGFIRDCSNVQKSLDETQKMLLHLIWQLHIPWKSQQAVVLSIYLCESDTDADQFLLSSVKKFVFGRLSKGKV